MHWGRVSMELIQEGVYGSWSAGIRDSIQRYDYEYMKHHTHALGARISQADK